MIFISKSEKDTQKIASKLALKYQNGAVIALSGNLGAGKTTFAQGFTKGLGIKNKIISPTFVLIKEYSLPQNIKDQTCLPAGRFYHIDLYRLKNQQEIENLGLNDLFINPKNIILIEWAEKLTNLSKSKKFIKINFEIISEFERKITITDLQSL